MKIEQTDTQFIITIEDDVFIQRKGRTVDNQEPLNGYEQVIVAACREFMKQQRDPVEWHIEQIRNILRETKGICVHGFMALTHPIGEPHESAQPGKVIPFPNNKETPQ